MSRGLRHPDLGGRPAVFRSHPSCSGKRREAHVVRKYDLNLTEVQTAQAYFDSTLARERMVAFLLGALGLGRTVRGLLFGVGPADPLVFASTLLVLMGVALAAGHLPGLRVARVDPVAAIRTE